MKQKRTITLILLTVLFVLSLFLINRDLLHYEYNFWFSRIFTPENDTKGSYLITEPIPLKPGIYRFRIETFSEGSGNGSYIVNSADEIIFAENIPTGEAESEYSLEIPHVTSVRAGIRYDPESGLLEEKQISFSSDHVIYRESILRHAVISALIAAAFAYIGLRLLKTDLPEIVRRKYGIDMIYWERVFLFLIITTSLASWPLFVRGKFTEGDDFYFHLSRIEGIAASLKAGYFPPRILLGWMGNYGVASEIYYPGLFMTIPVGLYFCGFNSITALKIFLYLCTFFSLLTMYLAGKKMSGEKVLCGAGAAVIYAFASYRLICLFYRNAVGEVQAYIFYPLIVWGFYEILRGNTQKWGIFALGFFGLLMSHLISLAIAGILCAVYLLFSIRKLAGNREMISAFAKAALITVLLGAFFLLPMLEQIMKNELKINTNISGSYEDWDEISFYVQTHFKNLFLPWDIWVANDERWLAPHPGWIILCVPLVRIFLLLSGKSKSDLRTADKLTLIGLLLLVSATDLFPWRFFKWFLLRIQFSWRMLGPASVLLSMSGGMYFDELVRISPRKKALIYAAAAAAVLSGMPILIITYKDRLYPYSRLVLRDKVIHGAEYMPPAFDPAFIDVNKDKVNTDDELTRIIESRRRKLGFEISFERIEGDEAVFYEVPLVYIYGYHARLTDENGVSKEIPVGKDDIGLILLSDEGHPQGTFRVDYQKTAMQKAGDLISALTLVCLIFFRRGQFHVKGARSKDHGARITESAP